MSELALNAMEVQRLMARGLIKAKPQEEVLRSAEEATRLRWRTAKQRWRALNRERYRDLNRRHQQAHYARLKLKQYG